MRHDAPARSARKLGLAAGLLGVLIVLATLAGGASSPDTLGQVLVRMGAAISLAIAVGAGLKFDLARYRGPVLLMIAALLLVAVQLVPLPPELWRALPGRAAFDLSAMLPEVAGAWRPAAITPGAAWNALFSLTVPACALMLLAATPRDRLRWGPPLLLAMVGLSSVVAALQFAGGIVDNPLINERLGFASGLLANRNHQALFLAIGVAAAAQWGAVRPFVQVRAAAAAAITAWFILMILATGSRAGLGLGLVALAGGGALAGGVISRAGVQIPRRTALLLAGLGILVLAGIVTASIYAGRSESISRLNQAVIGDDMRVRALPVVLNMARLYMPVGAGQGGFATLFRAAEPDVLLKPTYFNHAHNDFLEIPIEAGLPGIVLLITALGWFGRQAWRAWRLPPDGEVQRARLGAVVVLLVSLASTTDYPARTPLVMVLLVLAAGWLSLDRTPAPALPKGGASL